MTRREAAHTSYLCDECAADRRAAWARCYPDAKPFDIDAEAVASIVTLSTD
jgi:hypothetical protein